MFIVLKKAKIRTKSRDQRSGLSLELSRMLKRGYEKHETDGSHAIYSITTADATNTKIHIYQDSFALISLVLLVSCIKTLK